MTAAHDAESLARLIRAALKEADDQEDLLAAALLAQCLDTVEKRRRR